MSYWYLASPYSLYPDGLDAAHIEVCKAAGLLIKKKIPVYSPIAHGHMIAIAAKIDPKDHNIWIPSQKPMMDEAKGLIVLEMEGWRNSYGVNVEIDHFRERGKRIVHMTPGLVPMEFCESIDP